MSRWCAACCHLSTKGPIVPCITCNHQISPSKQFTQYTLLQELLFDQITSFWSDRTHRNHAATYLRLRTARPEPTAPPPRPSARLDSPPTTQSASALITGKLWIRAVTRSAGSGRRCWLQQHAPSIRWLHGGPHHQDGHGVCWPGNQCWTAVYGAERMIRWTRIGEYSETNTHSRSTSSSTSPP